MLATHGVRDLPILERLTLAHHIDPTFGFAPGTRNNHGRQVAARWVPTMQRLYNKYLRFQAPCRYFNLPGCLVRPTPSGGAPAEIS